MNTKFCLPIIKTNIKSILSTIHHFNNHYDMFEIYVDYIDDVETITPGIKKIIALLKDRVIILLRRKDKEKVHLSFDQRLKIIHTIGSTDGLLDLDVSEKEELAYIKEHALPIHLITSFHDYAKTPRTNALVTIIADMEIYHPEIYKIATLCETPKQALALMHLLLDLLEQKKKVIILGMGSHGRITRVFGALYGNSITYAPDQENEKTADGQLTKRQLEEIMILLGKGGNQ